MADGDIADWLTEQGLEVHASLFADNRIDVDVLTDLSEADLRELGLPLGDRKRLMKAIEALAGFLVLENAKEQGQMLGLYGAIAELEERLT